MKLPFYVILLLCAPVAASAQVTVTAPSGLVAVASADDFATRAFQDPWDMSQRSDLGWWVNGTDQPTPGLSNPTFSNGIFSARSTNGDPSVFLLETGNPNAAPLGKIGTNYPIDATRYRMLAFRMRVDTASAIQVLWNATSIFDGATSTGSAIATSAGWRIYVQSIPVLTLSGSQPWGGTVRALRFDPTVLANENIEIDWVRLVNDDPALYRTIAWSGGGSVDIYLDNDSSGGNGNLGKIAAGVSGGSYSFYVGALAPGTYYVAIAPAGGASYAYSPGAYVVNDIPTLSFTSPSDEGSSDDFATAQLNNAWDSDSVNDFDRTLNVNGASIRSDLVFENEAGVSLGQQRVYFGTSAATSGIGDPLLYGIWSTQRGTNLRVDPDRYRILTAELGIPGKARDLVNGSVVRVVWKVAGESVENVSDDIILNHRAGANVLAKLTMDMKSLPLDPSGSPSRTGWNRGTSGNPGLDNFRIDPHEFSAATPFFIKRLKLAALEKANSSYTIQWTYSKSAGTVQFFRSTDTQGSGQTAISGSLSATAGSYVWSTTGVPAGSYYILAVFSDGVNSNHTYAKWPVVIDGAAPVPTPASMTLSRSTLNFASLSGGAVKTSAQTVRVTVTGSSSACWSVAIPPAPRDFVTVTPSSGCGTGSFSVALKDLGYSGTAEGTLTVGGSGFSNAPQYVRYWVRLAAGATPSGSIDTPAVSSGVSGSIAVTGWVLDDLEVTGIQLFRDAVAGEAPGEKYIGDAVLVDDARPDIETSYPDAPRNYRAGWGYLLLTNMLPNQGNGPFTLRVYASDRDGHRALLGTKSLIGQNATATAPFGAIDTPGQGETASGTGYVNWGWALTPQPKSIPTDGSSIVVVVDGVVVGKPTYNLFRPDIASLFPGYANANGAIGYFTLNTAAYANGVHTIAWGVTDNAGVSSGIGSRYFNIVNGGSLLEAVPVASVSSRTGPPNGGHYEDSRGVDVGKSADVLSVFPQTQAPVGVRRGFDSQSTPDSVSPDSRGVHRIDHTELERVEVHLPHGETGTTSYEGYLRIGNRLEPLPIGTSLDSRNGTFSWLPGVGFVGTFDFAFVRSEAGQRVERVSVRVTLLKAP